MDGIDDTRAQLQLGSQIEPGDAEATSFLVVVIDLHSEGWLQHSKVDLWTVLTNLVVMLNAHIALDSGNELAIFGYNGAGVRMLYSSLSPPPDPRPSAETSKIEVSGTMIRQFRTLDSAVLNETQKLLAEAAAQEPAKATSVAGPLSLALTYLNRQLASNAEQRGHILIVSAAPDHIGSKYIPAMNSIFSAQKLRVPIDVANFGLPQSVLQQAADFTGGSYLDLGDCTTGLFAVFTSVFLVSPAVRQYVNLATKQDVDFSAVCFLTKSVVEIGYVCSVCLCIMEKVPSDHNCPVCHTHYDDERQQGSDHSKGR